MMKEKLFSVGLSISYHLIKRLCCILDRNAKGEAKRRVVYDSPSDSGVEMNDKN